MNSGPHNRVIDLWFPVSLLPPIGVFLSITFIINVVAASNHKTLIFYWQVLPLVIIVLQIGELFITRYTCFYTFYNVGCRLCVLGPQSFSGPTHCLSLAFTISCLNRLSTSLPASKLTPSDPFPT